MLSSSESRRRKKDPDRDRGSPKSKDKDRDPDREERKERHKSSKSSRLRKSSTSSAPKDSTERDPDRPREHSSKERMRTSSSSSYTMKPNRMAVVPEMERRGSMGSPNSSRTSLPYPTLSKSYAKENIYSREEVVERRKSPFTPEATDVGDTPPDQDRGTGTPPEVPTRAPPSPPLTATTAAADLRKTASANSMRRKNAEALSKEMDAGRRSVDSGTRLTPEPRFAASRSSIRQDGVSEVGVNSTDITSTTGNSQSSTVMPHDKAPHANVRKNSSASPAPRVRSRQASEITQSTDSDATSVAPDRQPPRVSPTNSEVSPASVVDSSPRTPTQHSVLPSLISAQKLRPPTVEIVADPSSRAQSVDPAYGSSPLPPPPPPPPPSLVDPPRVDYLLQNGGLSRPVPRSLLAAIDGTPATAYSQYTSPRMAGPQAYDVRSFFSPVQSVLDEYGSVIDNSGSIAVATGYRSVARRLLERLEHVFARNISSERCTCLMCPEVYPSAVDEEETGVNWGEILELVSGRCDLPSWPPFAATSSDGLGITDLEDPCQALDSDIPEEHREHYARQSRKTKVVVQSWLSNQQDAAPEEADDETLTFAMLTRLDQADHPLYKALLYGLKQLPSARAQPVTDQPTPLNITKAALALQRLYRLQAPPRDQLVVMYLINNPNMHNILATLSAVKKHEWEILVSGRFSGFLWSGAEDMLEAGQPSASGASGSSTARPFTPYNAGPTSRPGSTRPGSTRPGSTRPGGGAPVQIDEDTEIAVIAEVEREIFAAMEAMEDAFEQLHNSAEIVRRRLRERGAALSMVAQARRGSAAGGIEVRMGTPAVNGGPDVDGDALEDLRSEIGPDDSASNVSHNRRGRSHRSRARRTPAPVEEESEEDHATTLAERIRRRF